MKRFFPIFLAFIFYSAFLPNLKSPTEAVVDPLLSPNNKFGIHIISASQDEASPAADLVNSNGGDWGYITVLMESRDRDKNKWQTFFDYLRRSHLIPIVRLATEPKDVNWMIPQDGEEIIWAQFLDSLNWPIKNRYIIIYNEPNHGKEWGGRVDPPTYAQVLNKTIDSLKAKNDNFFVLNAGFDASSPSEPPNFENQLTFMREMEKTVPGIFKKLDGWVSHSYPNPNFTGSPLSTGRGTVRTWKWEMDILKSEFGVKDNLPILITETGWQHKEGLTLDNTLPAAQKIADYFVEAFRNAWSDESIVAVTPFLLNYQDPPFDHFSFKKIAGQKQSQNLLGVSYPEYYPHFEALVNLPKTSGKPLQESRAKIITGEIYKSIVIDEKYVIPFILENTGQSIWNEYETVILQSISGQENIEISPTSGLNGLKIEPGQQGRFDLTVNPKNTGEYKTILQLSNGNTLFDSESFSYDINVKSPVVITINSKLNLKSDHQGEYLLDIKSEVGESKYRVDLNQDGYSGPLESRNLLPDQRYTFTLSKDYYKPRIISVELQSGINNLDFGPLQPDFVSAILKPKELWELLPLSN